MNPLLKALHELGGSGSVEEISSRVSESLDLPEDVLSIPHDPEKSSQTELEYRLAWARTYLKRYGILDNSERGVWVIVPDKREVRTVNPREVVRIVRDMIRKEREERQISEQTGEELPEEAETWRSKLHHVLTKELSPDAFERLIKRLLRESGFVQVEETGRTGDGGIDGKGIIRVGGLLSFHVFFQCKKHQFEALHGTGEERSSPVEALATGFHPLRCSRAQGAGEAGSGTEPAARRVPAERARRGGALSFRPFSLGAQRKGTPGVTCPTIPGSGSGHRQARVPVSQNMNKVTGG